MITSYLKYVIDPYKLNEFEKYAKAWISLVNCMGGIHHGYFMPHEGANNIAYALFSFPDMAKYEEYRKKISTDKECQSALVYAERTRCIISFERSFMRPVFE
ncbi:NIPSNAP family protein [Clostridium sp. WILCCON 0269]|uniref:NIPSNAP family protein n=1 Tax=Candidatus Clostridium eludens TaxID=3381663 RepID=A0ABW8STA2_9CLOT